MRITHHGHSCLLVETGGARILLDPGNLSSRLQQAEGVDLVVMTHQHPDHADLDQLRIVLAASPDARVVAEGETAASIAAESSGELRPEPLSPGQTISAADAVLEMHGEKHAFNHAGMSQVGNLGVLVRSPGEPRFFHPGDAYDAEPGPVDVLALPVNAPWCAVRDTLDFVRRLGPADVVPIHDGLLSPAGRAMYLMHTQAFGGDDLEVHDLADGSARSF